MPPFFLQIWGPFCGCPYDKSPLITAVPTKFVSFFVGGLTRALPFRAYVSALVFKLP